MPVAPAGWYDDPEGRHQARYWDGANWSAQVADDGSVGMNPLRSTASDAAPPAQTNTSAAGPVGDTVTAAPGQVLNDGRTVDLPRGWRGVWAGMSTTNRVAGVIAIAIGIVALVVASTSRTGTETEQRTSTLSLPTSGEIGDMSCAQLNALVNRTGAELGLNPDGSVNLPPGITPADTRRIRVALADVERRVENLGGCAEQPNFPDP